MTAPERSADRVAAMVEARDEHAREVVAAASAFPAYEVPEFVRERFPAFDPQDPSTWPEPAACTDGRPYGHDSYTPGGILGRDVSDRWRRYLVALDRQAAGGKVDRWQQRSLGCRNRWRDEESRLCGTHVKPWRDALEAARRRTVVRARELEYLDLAKRLAVYGIEGDAGPHGVLLRRDAIEGVLRLLGQYAPFPSTDTTVPPPL